MRYSQRQELDTSLVVCKLIFVDALLSLVSTFLLLFLAVTKLAGGLLTLVLALCSLLLWVCTVWQQIIEECLLLNRTVQQAVRESRRGIC